MEPGVAVAEVGEQLAATDAEQIRHRYGQAVLGEHGMGLGLEPRAHPDELGPVTHELTPLAHLRGGDPRFGQHPGAQQVAEDLAVALIVLDPPTLERGELRGGDEWTLAPAACNASTAQYQP